VRRFIRDEIIPPEPRRRAGKREQAQEHLTTATTMYREMGMTYWLERAERKMGELT
jgi:hypothetical protein